jgi:hypothetical protein
LREAWGSQKSFPKDDTTPPLSDGDPKNPTVSFRGQKRSNATCESVTDPDARLARQSNGTASTLAQMVSVLIDNRHGRFVATDVRPPEAERDAAVEMLTTLERRARRRRLRADKGYDTPAFVKGARACRTTPHVAQNIHATKPRILSMIGPSGTPASPLFRSSGNWSKRSSGGEDDRRLAQTASPGGERVGWIFTFTNAAYDLVRMRTLIRATMRRVVRARLELQRQPRRWHAHRFRLGIQLREDRFHLKPLPAAQRLQQGCYRFVGHRAPPVFQASALQPVLSRAFR